MPSPAAASSGGTPSFFHFESDLRQVRAAVDDLLAPLGDRQRDVVWLRIIEGRSSAEVAAMLGTTAGNVDVIVHRALSRMREAQP